MTNHKKVIQLIAWTTFFFSIAVLDFVLYHHFI
jgi:hypothetical protein